MVNVEEAMVLWTPLKTAIAFTVDEMLTENGAA